MNSLCNARTSFFHHRTCSTARWTLFHYFVGHRAALGGGVVGTLELMLADRNLTLLPQLYLDGPDEYQ